MLPIGGRLLGAVTKGIILAGTLSSQLVVRISVSRGGQGKFLNLEHLPNRNSLPSSSRFHQGTIWQIAQRGPKANGIALCVQSQFNIRVLP